MIRKISLSLILSSLIASVLLPLSAFAASPAYSILTPDGFKFELPPGSSIKQDFQVKNLDETRGIVLGLDLNNLVLDANDKAAAAISQKNWVTLSDTSFKLEPGESKTGSVSISVPGDIKDGEYVVLMKAKLKEVTGDKENADDNLTGISISSAVGKKIELSVNSKAAAPRVVGRDKVVPPTQVSQTGEDVTYWSKVVAWFSDLNPLFVESILAILVVLLLVKAVVQRKNSEKKKK